MLLEIKFCSFFLRAVKTLEREEEQFLVCSELEHNILDWLHCLIWAVLTLLELFACHMQFRVAPNGFYRASLQISKIADSYKNFRWGLYYWYRGLTCMYVYRKSDILSKIVSLRIGKSLNFKWLWNKTSPIFFSEHVKKGYTIIHFVEYVISPRRWKFWRIGLNWTMPSDSSRTTVN